MIRDLDIFKIPIKDVPARESMVLLENFFKQPGMQIIFPITAKWLFKARLDQKEQEALKEVDLTYIAEKHILGSLGEHRSGRIREIRENTFFSEMMIYAYYNKKSVYLVGDSEEQINEIRRIIEDVHKKVEIVGYYSAGQRDGNIIWDDMINEVNTVTPDLIVAATPFADSLNVLLEEKKKMNGNVWFNISDMCLFEKHTGIIHEKLKEMAKKERLKKEMKRDMVENLDETSIFK